MSKGKVLCVSTDQALAAALAPTMKGRDFELQAVASAREASMLLSSGQFAGVVLDGATIKGADREALLAVHKQRANFPLVLLDTPGSLSPLDASALRRVGLPLPPGFADQVRACGKPVVFLVEQGVYASRAVQNSLQEAGVQPVSLESPMGVSDMLARQAELELEQQRQREKARTGSFWSRLGSGQQEAAPAARTSPVVVARFAGAPAEAEAFDGRLRQTLPAAVCYLISGIDATAEAVKAIRANFPAAVMRDAAGQAAQTLTDATQAVTVRSVKPRVLLADNNSVLMESYAQTLVANGYEVTPFMEAGKVLDMAQPGAFNLVVLGLPMAFVQNSSLELAKKLRERDADLGIILLVDPNPAPTATQAMSQASSLGVDEALLKPVAAGQLLRSIQRALEHRFLILENKRLLTEVQEQARKLSQINGFQTKFFSMVAHDVKNPLTAILGYSEVLGMRLKEPSELKCAGHIHNAAKTLNLLISDLVDLAAIESGKLRVTIGALDLTQVVQDVRSRIDVVANQRQIKFSVDCPAQLPPLAGDPARLGQVIQNLCTNAIQYTKEGGSVSVRVDVAADIVTVSVIDTGIGIKKEDLPRVWERFFQTAEAQAMRKAGFGLGLKISREIVQMHGGEIGIESEYGKGSRFFFTLPVQKGPAVQPAAPAQAAPAAVPVPVALGAPANPAPVPVAAPAAAPGLVPLAPAPPAPAPVAPSAFGSPVTPAPAPVTPAPGTQTLGTFGKPLGGPIPK